jgi:hypothetical protein
MAQVGRKGKTVFSGREKYVSLQELGPEQKSKNQKWIQVEPRDLCPSSSPFSPNHGLKVV